MKKPLSLLCALCLTAALLVCPASADGEDRAVSAYCQGDILYAALYLPDEDEVEDLSIGCDVNGSPCGTAIVPRKLEDSGRGAYFLVLLDDSSTMGSYRSCVKQYLAAFLDDLDIRDATFALAYIGGGYNPQSGSETTDRSDFQARVNSTRYNEKKAGGSIYDSLIQALDALDAKSRTDGEMVNILMLTDGRELFEGGPTQGEAVERIQAAQPVNIYTVVFGNTASGGERTALSSFAEQSGGTNEALATTEDSKNAGEELAEYLNDLCSLAIQLDEPVTKAPEVTLTLRSSLKQIRLGSVPLVAAPEEDTPSPFATPEPSASPDPSEAPSESPSDAPEHSAGPAASDSPETSDSPEVSDSPETSDSPGGFSGLGGGAWGGFSSKGVSPIWIALIALAVVVIALLVVLLVVLLRRRGGRTRVSAAPPAAGAVYMRMEVLSGDCATAQRDFYLSGQLVLGRDPGCDVVFRNPEVALCHARIFLRDNMIYVEDLGAQAGTCLGGMRLYAANRLRSGDEISLGPVHLAFKF